MKQWETNLYTAVVTSELYSQVQKARAIVREHEKFVSPLRQDLADQMFEHIVYSTNTEVLVFLQKTHHPSLPTLKLCLEAMVRCHTNRPEFWKWINNELSCHPTAEVKTHVKPIRVLERALGYSVQPSISYRCVRALQPYLQQNEINTLAFYARNSNHIRASRELLKCADLDYMEKNAGSYFPYENTDLQNIQKDIEAERCRRLKTVLNKQIPTQSTRVSKRKM